MTEGLPPPAGVPGRLEVLPVDGIPRAAPGDALAELLAQGLSASGLALQPRDVLVVASKLVSRCEGRFVDLAQVEVGPHARGVARAVGKEPALVELILQEARQLTRQAPGILITRHRLGHVSANSGVDRSNARPPGASALTGPWALLLPEDPDASARGLRQALETEEAAPLGVVITDTAGRPHRLGTVGLAIGLAGLPALVDHRGRTDLDGRALLHSTTALADQVAALADLCMGQAAEGRAAVVVRGLDWSPEHSFSPQLHRAESEDLFR